MMIIAEGEPELSRRRHAKREGGVYAPPYTAQISQIFKLETKGKSTGATGKHGNAGTETETGTGTLPKIERVAYIDSQRPHGERISAPI